MGNYVLGSTVAEWFDKIDLDICILNDCNWVLSIHMDACEDITDKIIIYPEIEYKLVDLQGELFVGSEIITVRDSIEAYLCFGCLPTDLKMADNYNVNRLYTNFDR